MRRAKGEWRRVCLFIAGVMLRCWWALIPLPARVYAKCVVFVFLVTARTICNVFVLITERLLHSNHQNQVTLVQIVFDMLPRFFRAVTPFLTSSVAKGQVQNSVGLLQVTLQDTMGKLGLNIRHGFPQ